MFEKLFSRAPVLLCAVSMLALLGGCAGTSMQRAKVEKIERAELVRVITPPLDAPSFMQGWVNSGTAGWLQAAIADSETKVQFSPRDTNIQDFGELVAIKLQQRLQTTAPWFPSMEYRGDAVPASYVPYGKTWLRLEVFRYELAPPPMRTVFVGVEASLRSAQNEPLWTARKVFSGFVHGGEKIDMDQATWEPSQLRRELERAADWITNQIANDARS